MAELAGPRDLGRGDSHFVGWLLRQLELTPARITLVYVVFGMSALYLSDVLLVQWVDEPLLSQLQALKGGVEIVVTGGLIFALTATKQAQADLSDQKLRRQREELLVLHRVLRHNLRNDLNVILGLSREITGATGRGRISEFGETITRTANEILHYTEQAERIRSVTAREGRSHDVDLAEEVPALVEEHPLVTGAVDVNLDVRDGPTVRVNHVFLDAVDELVTNAIEHNDDGTPRVEISVDPGAGPFHLVELIVADDGPGIPPIVATVLEESEYDQRTHLQGMGLWFVYWVVTASDGRMVIDRADDGGAAVRLQVPKASLVSAAP